MAIIAGSILAVIGISSYVLALIAKNDLRQMLDELDEHERRIS